MFQTGLCRVIDLQYSNSFFYSSFHIVFAILEVLRNDFSDIYDKILPHQALFPLFHYPAYRYIFVNLSQCLQLYKAAIIYTCLNNSKDISLKQLAEAKELKVFTKHTNKHKASSFNEAIYFLSVH